MKFDITKLNIKKVGGILMIIGAGVAAVFDEIANQKRESEFEELKRAVEILKGKKS